MINFYYMRISNLWVCEVYNHDIFFEGSQENYLNEKWKMQSAKLN